MRGNLLLLDTNVLLSASNEKRSDHDEARALFPATRAAGCHVAVCGQVLREYLAVATRPVSGNGLGMDRLDALHNAEWFRAQSVFLEEIEAVYDRMIEMVRSGAALGLRLHDLNIAAVAAIHGAASIVTANRDDFTGLPGINVLSIREALNALGIEER